MPSSPLPLFRDRSFLLFWSSRIFSTAGSQMQAVVVAWQVYQLTHSAFDLGMVGLVQFLPRLALMTVVGNTADRFDRQRIAFLGQLVQGLALAALAIASFSGGISRELIYALVIVAGAARSFEGPAIQALLPSVVGNEALPRAVALAASGMEAATIVAPALGGILYLLGATTVYAITAALFMASALSALLIRLKVQSERSRQTNSGLAHFLEGIRFIRAHRPVLGAISLDLFAVLLGGATALLPMFANDILHVGPWGLGLLRAAPAVGALLLSVWLAQHPLERRVGRTLIGAVAVFGVAMLVFALSASFWLSLIALAVSGAADMVSVVIRQTLVQLETPDAMRGRVSAVNSVFIGASNQLGEFESGATAALLGPVGSVLLGGVGVLLVAGLWTRLFPALWQRDRLHAGQG